MIILALPSFPYVSCMRVLATIITMNTKQTATHTHNSHINSNTMIINHYNNNSHTNHIINATATNHVNYRYELDQAILPLRGKILNIEKCASERIYQNNELQALISALGLGIKVSLAVPPVPQSFTPHRHYPCSKLAWSTPHPTCLSIPRTY